MDCSQETQDPGQLRREASEASQRSQRHSLTGEMWKSGGACAGTVRSASLSRTHGSTTSGLFSDFQPLEGSESLASKKVTDCSQETQDPGQLRRQASEAAQRSQRHALTGDRWKGGGVCAGTVRSASLSRTRGSTTSGLFSDTPMLAGSDSLAALRELVGEMR